MGENKWRTTAIIFMILFVLVTGYLIWATNIGTEYFENDAECSYNICEGYNAYQYDLYNKICYCFEGEEIAYQKYMR